MKESTPSPQVADDLATEIAGAAARLIALDGLDYATAKRKAAAQILGAGRHTLPDNAAVEAQLREYLATFLADTQPRILAALRALALTWMRRLAAFDPYLVGAVLNGTATEHSDVHLQLFADNAKEVEFFLLDGGIDFEAEEGIGGASAPTETLRFLVRRDGAHPAAAVGIVLDVMDRAALRVAPRRPSTGPALHPVEATGRANTGQLERLLRERPSVLAP